MQFETLNDAIMWRRLHRNKLKAGKKRQRGTARALNGCRNHHRCKTEACRVCMRDFRIELTGESVKMLLQRSDWTRCSVITKGLLIPYGQLETFDLDAAIKRLRKRMQRSALHGRVVLGGLDISLNIENNVIEGWQFHLYAMVEGQNDAALQQAVKDAFPAEPTALAPYEFTDVTDFVEVASYAYKALFERRSGYVGRDGNHRTAYKPLKAPDIRELLPFLVQYSVGARLVLAGVRRNGQRLAFTTPKPPSESGNAQKTAGEAAAAW